MVDARYGGCYNCPTGEEMLDEIREELKILEEKLQLLRGYL